MLAGLRPADRNIHMAAMTAFKAFESLARS